MSREYFSERLKRARKDQKLTLVELAERANTTQAQLSRLETGKRKPSHLLASTLARVLGVREAWLLDGEEPAYQDLTDQKSDDVQFAESIVDEILDSADSLYDIDDRNKLVELTLRKIRAVRKEIKNKIESEEESSIRKKGTIIEGPFRGASFNNISGKINVGDTIITSRHTTHVKNIPPQGSITEAQAHEIHLLLVRIGELESNRLGTKAYGIVMNQFKNRYKLPSYKNLQSELFSEAIAYLKKRIKTLESVLSKEGKRPYSRDDLIRRIQTICKRELKWTDPIRRQKMIERRNKASLKEFIMAELEDFYWHVTGLASGIKKKGK